MSDPVNPKDPVTNLSKKVLLAAILSVGTLLYVVAVTWIGLGSIQHVNAIEAAAQTAEDAQAGEAIPSPEPYPITDFISQALLIIGGALATHLGAYLGINITAPSGLLKSALADATKWKDFFKSADGVSGILSAIYFISLVAAIVFWALTDFSPYAGKPLQDLSYSFLGVFAGAMAALSQSS